MPMYKHTRQDSRKKHLSPPCSAARRNLSSIGARTVIVSRPSCACQLGSTQHATDLEGELERVQADAAALLEAEARMAARSLVLEVAEDAGAEGLGT